LGLAPKKLPAGVGEMDRSAERAISLERCSNTYRPLVVVSLMDVVFVVLTTPFTRNATTATMSMHATPSVTTISTSVNATLGGFCRSPSFFPPVELFGGFMGLP
jgi:hypothetical protein